MIVFSKFWPLMLAAAALVACGDKRETALPKPLSAEAPKPEPLKAAWVYVGPVADAGWNFSHERARKDVEAYFGDKVRTTFVENVHEGAEAERVTRDLAAKGNKIIFATSSSFMANTSKIAGEFPDVKFEQVDGKNSSDNLRAYGGRFFESAYLAGVIAGRMTKGNTLGFVGAFPSPESLQDLNAFTLGARSVNSKVMTKVVWIDAWFDPLKEGNAAQQLIDGGADVLMQNTYSTAVLQTAEKNGKHAFGWNSDMSAFAPNAHLASCVVDWTPYYRKASQAVIDGNWTSTRTVWGVREAQIQFLRIADFVPADTKRRVEKLNAGLMNGSFAPYTGPVLDNTGKERLVAGTVASQAWLDNIDFYVAGVVGKVPARR
ncbi:BMP family ABC transporter substrate-binding protein [soil metagenome]